MAFKPIRSAVSGPNRMQEEGVPSRSPITKPFPRSSEILVLLSRRSTSSSSMAFRPTSISYSFEAIANTSCCESPNEFPAAAELKRELDHGVRVFADCCGCSFRSRRI